MKYLLSIFILALSSNLYAGERILFAESECKAAYEYHFLNRAVANEDMQGITYLVEAGADINGKGYVDYIEKCGGGMEYSSPLMVAVHTKNIKIVKYLLEHGANPNLREGEGITPIYISQRNNNKAITELLIKYGAK